ncbi:hypothetical cytosolic protein [Syntrophus aciditrophicus SB]|uniref:Hypothetical cytosolic protein n=1 Tax=Syntrophus aciditrophicus (strain SB) TaxID=56780 RepID=Q2LRY2_SYNAS|nr:hypothetical cytosolic protein [Syntrophus aciditrophicus SB]
MEMRTRRFFTVDPFWSFLSNENKISNIQILLNNDVLYHDSGRTSIDHHGQVPIAEVVKAAKKDSFVHTMEEAAC